MSSFRSCWQSIRLENFLCLCFFQRTNLWDAVLVLLSNSQYEDVKLITGLPVNEYAGLKDKYKSTLLGKHYIQLLNPDGSGEEFYSFNITEVKILPQPVGTIFDAVLSQEGAIEDTALAKARIGVIDVGKFTVDLSLTDSLQFVDKSSTSYNDIGIFDAYRDLSLALKGKGYDIPADNLEPFIKNGKHLAGLTELKEAVFASQAEKIVSRVYNTWSNLWDINQIFITGGGAVVLGEYLLQHFDRDNITICDQPTFTNCKGYYKFARKLWG